MRTEPTPIDGIAGMPPAVAEKLRAAWISTAEELVASTSAVGGPDALAGHLGVTVPEFRKALAAAEAAVPPGELARLRTPVDPGQQGLGANRPGTG